MVAENQFAKDLVVRIRAANGRETLTPEDVAAALKASMDCGAYIVQEVEGGSLDKEILAQTVRQVLKDNIYGPLSADLIKRVQDIDAAWQEVKDKVEGMLQGKFATCPSCGAPALSQPFCDKSQFICPSCAARLKWNMKPDAKHPDGGRYVLVPM